MIVIVRLVLTLAVIYGLVLLAVYWGQRSLQYFPTADLGDPKLPEALKFQSLKIKTADGLENLAWYAPPADTTGKVIVYFHGNGGNISHRLPRAAIYLKRGYGVMLCEYRGYGGNRGKPTEKGLYDDARACVRYLADQGISTAQLILYGESIGSGVAVEMAREFQPPRLVLEAPFSSAADVAKIAYPFLPVDMLMQDRFDSIDKIKDVKSALLIVHGTVDGIVPYRLGQKLFEAANHPKEFVSVEGAGHSDLYDYKIGEKVLDWLGRETVE
ncbi:MAG TPA: alpha/beta hydrolase [Patescibacteria group bacterium]|nr:alpha/beta hydrolase [Patescibacteria group bacterium]